MALVLALALALALSLALPVVDPGVLSTAGLHRLDVGDHVPHRDVALVIRVDLVVHRL